MKVVILAGGYGTRISEYTKTIPKPMIKINGIPLIKYIINHYSSYGHNDFYIALGYKGNVIKRYFRKFKNKKLKINLIDTGLKTMTGGRLRRLRKYFKNETFLATYGDGLSDVNISNLQEFHKSSSKLATLTAVKPPGRYGAIDLMDDDVINFVEKPAGKSGVINGGFFVIEPCVFDFIDGDQTAWEDSPINALIEQKQLVSYTHRGFWRPMDTLRDKNALDESWKSGAAPWKIWQ